MPVTIYDVAKKAGVGIGMVSRVTNNSPRITRETKAKVLRTIRELNYEPHTSAQSLARRKTKTIGCIIPFVTGHFFSELLQGIQQKLMEFEYALILWCADNRRNKEFFLRRALRERRVDGILCVSMEITPNYVDKFLNSKLPIVLVDGFHPDLDSITVENTKGAYIATRHLIELGYKKIAMIDGQLKSIPARLRYEGFKKALREQGFPLEERYFVACDFVEEREGFNEEAGYTAMQKLLDLGTEKPRAVFVSSDIQAIGAMQAIKERSFIVPDDIAIIGFDDIELARYVGLTTMRQPIVEMGELAVKRFIEKISGDQNSEFKHNFLTELVVRASCGAN